MQFGFNVSSYYSRQRDLRRKRVPCSTVINSTEESRRNCNEWRRRRSSESVALLIARRTNNRKVVGSRPTKVVCIAVLTGNRLGWTGTKHPVLHRYLQFYQHICVSDCCRFFAIVVFNLQLHVFNGYQVTNWQRELWNKPVVIFRQLITLSSNGKAVYFVRWESGWGLGTRGPS